MSGKKLAGFGLCLALLGCAAAAWAKPVTILSLNDIHSGFFPREATYEVKGAKVKEMISGLGRVASVLKQERAKAPGMVLTLNAGDLAEGPVFFYFNEDCEIAAMNALGFDAATIGNHELDHNIAGLRKFASHLNFPQISSNLKFKDRLLDAMFNRVYIKKMADGTRVGVFGLMAPELKMISSAKDLDQITVEQDLEGVAAKQIARLRSLGCDVVIALTHIGFERDKILASKVSGLNAIVGGHSHTILKEMDVVTDPSGNQVPIVQTGSHAQFVGRLVLDVSAGKTNMAGTSWSLIELRQSVPVDAHVQAIVDPYQVKLKEMLGRPIGKVLDPMDARKTVVRMKESNAGSFLADAMRWYLKADLAFINGGNIRGDRVYPAGDISYLTLLEMNPWSNTLNKAEMTGAQVRELLEISASAVSGNNDKYNNDERTPTGGWLQVSGLRVTFDLAKQPALIDNKSKLVKAGSRVVAVEVQKADGSYAPIDPKKTYTVGIYKWTATGGDKYYLFPGIKSLDTQVVDLEIIKAYIDSLGGKVKMPVLGRMIFR